MNPGIVVLIDRHAAGRYADATFAALDHAITSAGVHVPVREVPTVDVDDALIRQPGAGVVVGPGSPYDRPDAVLEVIRSARKRGVPLVGT